jgi:hypothetical protein
MWGRASILMQSGEWNPRFTALLSCVRTLASEAESLPRGMELGDMLLCIKALSGRNCTVTSVVG